MINEGRARTCSERNPASDFREYVAQLVERNDIRIVDRSVDPKFELAAVLSRSQKESDSALLFRNVAGTDFPVVANVYGSFERLAEMLHTDMSALNMKWSECIEKLEQDNGSHFTLVGSQPDLISGKLGDLPHITYRGKDAAPYITAGVFLARDPETGVHNLSFCRCMMIGDDSIMMCCIDPPHDLAKYQAKAEKTGQALEVAILIGAPPVVFLAAAASLPIEQDELTLAAIMNGAPLEMRRAQTLDLQIPAATEIVIEATIRPNERSWDGPFGEFLGYYCSVNHNAYILDIRNVSWRKGALFQGLLCGSREDLTLLSVSWGARIQKTLSASLPGILEAVISPALFGSIVKIDKQYDTHAADVIERVFRMNPGYNRMCIVVDQDIDIHDLGSVWWAFLTRGNLDSRVFVHSDLPGAENANYGFTGYLGIDATMPLGSSLERASTPGEDEINLRDYIRGN